MREVDLHHHAILAADSRLALELIAQLTLVGPLTTILRTIGIQSRKGVGLVHREGRHLTDFGLISALSTIGFEEEVVTALRLCEDAEALLRIGSRQHGRRSLAVNIFVERGIRRLLRILCQDVEAVGIERHARIPGIDVAGHHQAVVAIEEVLVVALVLVDEATTKRQARTTLGKTFEPAVERQLHVASRHPGVVVGPVAALLARESLEAHTLDGRSDDTGTQQRVVDTQ